MEPSYRQLCAWRLLVAAGNTTAAIARLTGLPDAHVREAVYGPDLPAVALRYHEDGIADMRWHRARLELRRSLDLLDRSAGPDGCWASTGWHTRDGRAGRASTFLGTRTLARGVLMVTSGTLEPSPGLEAAHGCHAPWCANPRCLHWADRPTNSDHRRRQRLAIAIAPRPAAETVHLDVLDRDLTDLEFLARLEAYLDQLEPGGPDHPHCLVKAGTAANRHYTTVQVDGRRHKLHRWMLQAAGADLAEHIVLHSCDHPPCVGQLDHLRPGTPKCNQGDAAAKGRLAAGENHFRAAYTTNEVASMRSQLAAGARDLDALGRIFGGHPQTVKRAVRGSTYRNVDVPPVPLPVRRRLTDCGIKVVRALIAVGVADHHIASRVGLTEQYLRDVATGRQRTHAGGVIIPPPGPATGRKVATCRLGPHDIAYIVRRARASGSKRAIARDLGIHARSVGRVLERAESA